MANVLATPPPEATIQTIALRTQDTDEADGDAHLLQTLYTEAIISIACPDGVVRTSPRTVLVHGASCGVQSIRQHVSMVDPQARKLRTRDHPVRETRWTCRVLDTWTI